MHKGFLKTGAILSALSVILGAFAAHKLRGSVSDSALTTFETAVKYQLYHAFAIIFTGILFKDFRFNITVWAGRMFAAGILLFSGSLYLLAYLQATVSPGYMWVGAITPFGGVCFILGWVFLFVAFFKQKETSGFE